jgi:DNA topoisomerase-3
VPIGDRALLTQSLLQSPERRPAIVYVPTRRQAESMARDLNAMFRTAPYHAGLDTKQRKQTQEDFLANRLETVVATIAFGMGIDKPDVRTVIHMALPSSVEAYYQEIGRAGRDGALSRAILMHTYSDRMTHDYFFGQSYPEADELAEVYRALPREPEDREAVAKRLAFDDEGFSRILEKLWTHGGAVIEIGGDLTERVGRGADNWRPSYSRQREYKRDQLRQIQRYADASECRMLTLVRHFGDLTDARRPCDLCDFCRPGDCLAQAFRAPTAVEQAAAEQILAVVRTGKRPTARMLHEQYFEETPLDRTAIENLLNGLARAGYVHLEQTAFEKDGRRIPFSRVGPGPKIAGARIEF